MSHSKKPSFENVDYYLDLALNIAYYRRLAGYTQVSRRAIHHICVKN